MINFLIKLLSFIPDTSKIYSIKTKKSLSGMSLISEEQEFDNYKQILITIKKSFKDCALPDTHMPIEREYYYDQRFENVWYILTSEDEEYLITDIHTMEYRIMDDEDREDVVFTRVDN